MRLQVVKRWRDVTGILLMMLCMVSHAASREDRIQEIRKLNEQAHELHQQGRYQDGIPIAQRAVATSEKELGPEHPETASSLESLAELHRATSAYAQAEQLQRRALEIREKVLGPQDLQTASSLDNLGALYVLTGDYDRAEPLHQRALALREKLLGAEHPGVAESLNNLASVYYATGTYAKAEPLYERALAIRSKVLGPDHEKTATSLGNLAALYTQVGDHARAEPLLQRALAISEKVVGPEHPRTAGVLGRLASLYRTTGAYTKAELLHKRALAIRQKALGPEHPQTSDTLNNLANIYMDVGDYANAEALHKQALAIREKALGREHPRTSDSLNNLAGVYVLTGAYAKAEPLYQRALTLRETALGPQSPLTIEALSNLANLYAQTGLYAKAEPLYQRALAIYKKVLPEHPDTANVLYDLAGVYSNLGDYPKAEPLYQQALAILEKSLGPEHPYIANPLNSLANLYRETGAYSRAEPLAQRALAIRRTALGAEHPSSADALNDIANLYSAMGMQAKAGPLYQQAQDIQARNTERFLLTGSESRKQDYLREVAKNTYRNVSFSISAPSPESVALGLKAVLYYKGRVLDEISGSVARLRQSVKPADRELLDRLAEVANQFSNLTYQGLGNLSPEQYRQRLDALRRQQEELESDLARRSGKFRQRFVPLTLAAVQGAIPKGAVLVEWYRYRPFDPRAARSNAQQAPARYAAYVLAPGGEPSVIDIGDARVVEASVLEYLQAVRDPTRKDVMERARGLSEKIIEPLLAHLQGAERLLISADGILNLLPMAALLDEKDQYLVQRFEITYLTSGRDLLRMGAASDPQDGAVIVADPDYGKPVQLLAAAEPPMQAQRSVELDRSGVLFRPLSHTATEAQAIESLLKPGHSSVMLRGNATESNLKQLHGPRILHVASHGFFLSDQDLSELGSSMPKAENPLLRAGIALAGANERRSGTGDDGILTALEAAQLDLQGTELVVLSACETGIGQVQNGEGVYGLRRALFIAGAQTQIATLWNVLDKATSTLMVDYYRGLLKGGGRSGALRQAQQRMLATSQRAHPYYWAGFVPIGDWSPLSAKR